MPRKFLLLKAISRPCSKECKWQLHRCSNTNRRNSRPRQPSSQQTCKCSRTCRISIRRATPSTKKSNADHVPAASVLLKAAFTRFAILAAIAGSITTLIRSLDARNNNFK